MVRRRSPSIQAIIPAAGKGTRLKSSTPKPLVLLNGKPLLIYALNIFQKHPLIDSVVLVAPKPLISKFGKLLKKYRLTKVKAVVAGGKTRAESVLNGLNQLDADTEIVVVHDAARPFIAPQIITQAINACRREAAVIVAVPLKPTIKKVNAAGYVQATLNRRELWDVQTPQIFKKEILQRAYRTVGDLNVTDEAALVERLGEKVKVVKGEYRNIKITTAEDLLMAQLLLKRAQ